MCLLDQRLACQSTQQLAHCKGSRGERSQRREREREAWDHGRGEEVRRAGAHGFLGVFGCGGGNCQRSAAFGGG